MIRKDDIFLIEVPHGFSSVVEKIEGSIEGRKVRFQTSGKTCHVPYEWCKSLPVTFGPHGAPSSHGTLHAATPFRVGDIVHIKYHGDNKFVVERVVAAITGTNVTFGPGYDVSPISNPRFVRRFSHDDLTLVSRPPNRASQDKLDLQTAIENLKCHGISKYQFENRLLDVLKLITKKLYG